MTESTRVQVPTSGMHCNSCAMMIKMTLEDLDGVTEASADSVSGVTTVAYDPQTVDVDTIVGAIRAAGYDAEAPAA